MNRLKRERSQEQFGILKIRKSSYGERKCEDGLEKTEEVTRTETDGQILAFETYA